MTDSTGKKSALIDIRNAVVSYHDKIAVDGVTVTIEFGDFVGIVGPNGAGKSTLLKTVNGLAQLTHGQVCVLGMQPYRGDGHRVRKRIGYVAQADRIDPRHPISVYETVMTGLHGRLGWLKRPQRDHKHLVEQTLERVGMAQLAKRPIGHLSGGEYQRVAIARALVQRPAIFLFDEPTASIDPKAQEDILHLVQEINKEESAAMLYVTHELATLPAACSRIIHMKDGRITGDGPRSKMLQQERLNMLYGKHTAVPISQV